jgi:hypothetical protein
LLKYKQKGKDSSSISSLQLCDTGKMWKSKEFTLLFLLIVSVCQIIKVHASFLRARDEPGDDPKNRALGKRITVAEDYQMQIRFLNYDEVTLKEMKMWEEGLKKRIEDLKNQDVPLNFGREDEEAHQRLRESIDLLNHEEIGLEEEEKILIDEMDYLKEQKALFESLPTEAQESLYVVTDEDDDVIKLIDDDNKLSSTILKFIND